MPCGTDGGDVVREPASNRICETDIRVARLILGKTPQDFDGSVDVPAGPWCFQDHPQDFDTWSELPFVPDIRERQMSAPQAFARCVEYRDRLFPRLVGELNRLNESTYSNEFWRQLIDYWLITLVQILYVAEHTVAELVKAYGDRQLDVDILPREIDWCFRDTEGFVAGSLDSLDFFVWALSRSVERAKPAHWNIRVLNCFAVAPCGQQAGASNATFGIVAKNALRRLLWAIRARTAPRCVGVYGVRGWRAIALSVLLACKPAVPPRRGASSLSPLRQPTDMMAPELEIDAGDFLDLAMRVLPDSFRNVAAIPSLGWRSSIGKLRIVGNVVVVSDAIKKAVAISRERGEFVLGSQHGACYGDLALPATARVEFALDGFITWGWRSHPSWHSDYLPLPSPHLTKFKHKGGADELIMIGVYIPLFYPRIEGTYGSSQLRRYVRNKAAFLSAIDERVFARLLYRPHLFSYSMNDVPYLQNRFPQLRLLQRRPEQSLRSCRLAVIDNPSTVLFQALAANVPTVAYWDRDFYEMHDSAVAVYDVLRKAGILFDEAQAAAVKVNEIWDSVGGWWNDPAVQSARETWCNEYARSSVNWFGEWASALWKFKPEASAEYAN